MKVSPTLTESNVYQVTICESRHPSSSSSPYSSSATSSTCRKDNHRRQRLPPTTTPMVAILSGHLKAIAKTRGKKSSWATCSVRLTDRYLSFKYIESPTTTNNNGLSDEDIIAIPVSDIIGCRLVSDHENESKSYQKFSSLPSAIFQVYSYPDKTVHHRLSFKRSTKKVRVVLTFAVDSFHSLEENKDEAIKWLSALSWLKVDLRRVISYPTYQVSIPPELPSPKRLLVMVNPASGPGKALTIFNKEVFPLLAEAGIHVTLFVTTSSGSASDYIKVAELRENFDGIVIISGDGLIFEVVNGLMERPDAKDVLKAVPLGIIPGGSGNGLAYSILHAVGDTNPTQAILSSTLNIMGFRKTPLDLIRVETSQGDVYHSFLSIGWGLLADIDIESESLRCLGGFRFTVWGVVRCFALRKYRGRLSYLPFHGSNPFIPGSSFQSSLAGGDSASRPDNTIPNLCDPVPSNWTVIEDEFVMVYAGNVTHMASDCYFAPSARLDDGVMWLLILRGNLSIPQVVQCMTALDTGKHTEMDHVCLIPVQAFRLEPLGANKGVLTIDGELIKTDKLQAHVLPSCLSVMSK